MARHLRKGTLSGGIARIIVGPQEIPFDVHLQLLRDCSPYFESLYRDRAALDITKDPVCLSDEDPDVFAEIIRWMYRDELSIDPSSSVDALFLFQLWVLAGTFEIPELQNAAMSLCKKRVDNMPQAFPSLEIVNFAYTYTPPGSPLRRLVVDIWMQRATMTRYLVRKDELPRAFLEDLCGRLIGRIESMGISESALPGFEEFYYVHPSPPRHSNEEESSSRAREAVDVPQLATPAQMQNRKVKRPSSKIRRSSRSSSLGDMTPASAVVDGEPKDIITEEMTHLKI